MQEKNRDLSELCFSCLELEKIKRNHISYWTNSIDRVGMNSNCVLADNLHANSRSNSMDGFLVCIFLATFNYYFFGMMCML